MTDEELAAIQTRCDAATPGPWREDSHGLSAIEGAPEAVAVAYDVMSQEDLTFIASARSDVPALVAEVQRLRADLIHARHSANYWGTPLIQEHLIPSYNETDTHDDAADAVWGAPGEIVAASDGWRIGEPVPS